jgi:hypothetical protein
MTGGHRLRHVVSPAQGVADCPTGKSAGRVVVRLSSPICKNISFFRNANQEARLRAKADATKQSILDTVSMPHHGLLRCARNDGCETKRIPSLPAASGGGEQLFAMAGCLKIESPSSSGLTGRPGIPETPVIEPISRGVLDPPHVRGMTIRVSTMIWIPSLRGAKATKQSIFSFLPRDGLLPPSLIELRRTGRLRSQ